MSSFQRRDLERLRHYKGEMLSSRDLRDQMAINDQLRWWHARAAHGAYGVAAGYEVDVVASTATTLTVKVHRNKENEDGLGVAYDCYGRELIMNRKEVLLTREFAAKPLTLVVQRRDVRSLQGAGRIAGACLTDAPGLINDCIAFDWVDGHEIGPADGVPIAYIDGFAQKVNSALPSQGISRLPIVERHETELGNPKWEAWEVGAGKTVKTFVGIEVYVDTTIGRFTERPCYFAWLRQKGTAPSQELTIVAFDSSHIEEPSATGFRFGVILGHGTVPNVQRALEIANQLLVVEWLGVRPQNQSRSGTN
jgi:hypothetical protein